VSKTVSARALELAGRRVAFVHARVVRTEAPSSARPGDEAIVHGDGTIDGFVGGVCAEGTLRTAALGVLSSGIPLLLRIQPEDGVRFPDTPGAQVVVNPCLSGGSLEIFLEPVLPPPMIEIAGRTPIAEALAALAGVLGYAVERSMPDAPPTEHATAMIVAGQGHGDAEAVRAALAADIPYVALVASRRRGAALFDELGLTDSERARIKAPAGLDIGARTPPEVALSILAEVIEVVRSRPAPARPPSGDPPAAVVDPVCGMTVTVVDGTPRLEVGGREFWFCGSGCRDRYAAMRAE